mgnify:CR=1 FL=1
MKKICKAFLLIIAVPTLALAQDQGFKIEGKAPKSLEGKKVYIDYAKDGFPYADSAVIKKGKFLFKGHVNEPNYVRMALDHDNEGKMKVQYNGDRLYFYIANENYELKIKDSLNNVQIKGEEFHKSYQEYLTYIGGDFMSIIDQANATFSAVPQDASDKEDQYKAIKARFDQKFDDRNDKQLQYALENPSSFFSVEGLVEVSNKKGILAIEPAYLNLTKNIRETINGKELESRLLAAKNIKIGNEAPDFAQPDQDGKMVKLSDFKGKYLLLDFWASWCAPCRAENPNLKKAYEQYKSKGLEVLAVSIDDKNGREAWLKAIKDDGLPWVHVADLKGWRNEAAVLYGVRGVPTNYLIDPTGKIVALNLRDEKLHEVLAQFLTN